MSEANVNYFNPFNYQWMQALMTFIKHFSVNIFHLSALRLTTWLSIIYELTDAYRASVSPFPSVAGMKEPERFALNLSAPNILIASVLSPALTDWQIFSENHHHLFTYKTRPLMSWNTVFYLAIRTLLQGNKIMKYINPITINRITI